MNDLERPVGDEAASGANDAEQHRIAACGIVEPIARARGRGSAICGAGDRIAPYSLRLCCGGLLCGFSVQLNLSLAAWWLTSTGPWGVAAK